MINKVYLENKVKSEVCEFFAQNGFVQLNNFLEEKFDKFKLNIENEQFNEVDESGIQRKKTLNLKNIYKFEIIEIVEFFKSKEFIEFIEELTDFEIFLSKLEVNLYGKGDFIQLNEKNKEDDCINLIFDMSDIWEEKYGGILTYTSEQEEIFYLEPSSNTLSILYKPQEVTKYMKSVNNNAKGKILRIELTFSIED